ncbi:MAG: hypothetical protein NVS2B7_36220 [Herpetosiphon sp.]
MSDGSIQRLVPFYGDELIAVQQTDGNIFVHFGMRQESVRRT